MSEQRDEFLDTLSKDVANAISAHPRLDRSWYAMTSSEREEVIAIIRNEIELTLVGEGMIDG